MLDRGPDIILFVIFALLAAPGIHRAQLKRSERCGVVAQCAPVCGLVCRRVWSCSELWFLCSVLFLSVIFAFWAVLAHSWPFKNSCERSSVFSLLSKVCLHLIGMV